LTSVALAPVAAVDLVEPDAVTLALARVAEARRRIPTAKADELVAIRGWAAAMNAVAQAKEAHALAIEACSAQVRAERQIGLILYEGRGRGGKGFNGSRSQQAALEREFDYVKQMFRPNERTMFEKLARIPRVLFERTMDYAEGQSRSFSASWIYRSSRWGSLKSVAPNITQAWDGSCYVLPLEYDASGHWRKSLDEAQEYLVERTGMKRDWNRAPAKKKLDDLYTRARQLSTSIALVRETLSLHSQAAAATGEAELAAMKTADALARAYNEQTLAEPT
jgi:hypothetical protein